MTYAVILPPLHPASLTHKNNIDPQRRKIIHGMRPEGCKDRSNDLNMRCICRNIRPDCVMSVAIIINGCC